MSTFQLFSSVIQYSFNLESHVLHMCSWSSYLCPVGKSLVKNCCYVDSGRKEMSAYNLEHADVGRLQQRFELYDAEARALLGQGLPIPA